MRKKSNNIIQKRAGLILVGVFVLLLAGCGKKQTVYFPGTEESTVGEGAAEESLTETTVDKNTAENAETEENTEPDAALECCVYVCGAVKVPGVYTLPAGSRVYEAIAMAGGMSENAAFTGINQAEPIQDGQMILVLTEEEMRDEQVQGDTAQSAAEEVSDDGRVNLNTATRTQLMTLPGIGEAKADSIIAYREENGRFSSIEDIKKIEGIKEGVFEKIKDSIVVN